MPFTRKTAPTSPPLYTDEDIAAFFTPPPSPPTSQAVFTTPVVSTVDSGDPFRPPTPKEPFEPGCLFGGSPDISDKSPPTTPEVFPAQATSALPPLPLLALSAPAVPVAPIVAPPPKSPWYRIPRRDPAPPPAHKPKTLQTISYAQQLGIQRTAKRRETRAARRVYKRKNPHWICDKCQIVCVDKASEAAHKATKAHKRKDKDKPSLCIPCDFQAQSHEDYARHINGRRHKRRISHKK